MKVVKAIKLNLLVFTCFLLVLTGCKGGTSSGGNPITDADVRKGTDGLFVDFAKNAPPEKVFEDAVFPIAVSIKNKGASDVQNGILVFGFEKRYVDAAVENEGRVNFDLNGKSIFNLNGDEMFVAINGKTKIIGAQSETHPSTILATTCYKYRTELGISACVDPDILGTTGKDQKTCVIKDLEFKEGQGAPVVITKVETRMLPDADPGSEKVRPHFIIYIENKGNGEVIVPEQEKIEGACSKEPLSYKDFNSFAITAFLSNEELECNIGADGTKIETRLREKKDVVRCTLREGISKNSNAYTSPLRVVLDYGYTHTISKNIIIEKILTY